MTSGGGEGELAGSVTTPVPDIHALFSHYNAIYFQDSLGPFTVEWSSKLRQSPSLSKPKKRRKALVGSPGSCRYPPKYDPAILLSESDFKFRPSEDLKNILLHEMIHAYLFMKHGITDRNKHDLLFETLMDGINSNFLIDQERPIAGYNIIFRHLLNQDVERNRDNHWITLGYDCLSKDYE
ncbi:hypothetical protein QJS10_CPB22g01161 [Acorus calamus]|uniref:SprT-like domain-containing protein n=1 Tax=Acorus calamus TaxID=4465 RepID=A0AAV9C390_ACOCL|nr:hypothetical protein QJS10_CPB22g01161 [Acorus calamus]